MSGMLLQGSFTRGHPLCSASARSRGGAQRRSSVGLLAGVVAIAIIVFGWPLWPIGVVLIGLLLIADFALET